jgi:hypothetical protein
LSEIDIAAATEAYNAATQTAAQQAATPSDQGTAGLERNELGQWVARQSAAEPVVEQATPDVPAEPAATPVEGTEEPSFTHIDPNVLPPEMQQLHRSLQADYTRKTQEAAPWRKLAQEFNVESPDEFRDALVAYQNLQDPRNWPTVVQELSQYMQQYGMSPAEANLAAQNQLAQMAPAEEDLGGEFVDDESLAPIVRQLQQTQAQLAQMQQQWQEQQQRQAEELQWQTLAQGLTKAEMEIRAQNPHYSDDDIETIYNMMGNDGNLIAAQQRYESVIGSRVAKYLQGKQKTQISSPGVVPGAGVLSQEQTPQPKTMEEAYRMGLAYLENAEREAQ